VGRCGCGNGGCACALSSTDCLAVTGAGSVADPFEVAPVVSPDTGNILVCQANGLFAGHEVWTSWTPTFVNFTIGNGTVTGAYARVGRTIHFYFKVVLGSTSSMGSGPTYTLPAAAAARYSSGTIDVMAHIGIADTGTANFGGVSYWDSSTTGKLQAWTASGTYIQASSFTSTIPMTWASTDAFVVYGTYEASA